MGQRDWQPQTDSNIAREKHNPFDNIPTVGNNMRFLMELPTFPGPIPLPTRTTEEVADNDQQEPKSCSQRKHPYGKLPILVVVLANAMWALINVWNCHQAKENEAW